MQAAMTCSAVVCVPAGAKGSNLLEALAQLFTTCQFEIRHRHARHIHGNSCHTTGSGHAWPPNSTKGQLGLWRYTWILPTLHHGLTTPQRGNRASHTVWFSNHWSLC